MSCAVDLKAYVLEELDRGELASADQHLSGCDSCREELERLRLTHSALMAMPEHEIPQRIAFVSDRVFEPRWWQRIWHSGPAMGFASAVLIAGAILAHGRAPQPVQPPQVDTAAIQRQIHAEVAQVAAQIEARDAARTAQLVAAAEKRMELRHRTEMASAEKIVELYQQQAARMMVASNQREQP